MTAGRALMVVSVLVLVGCGGEDTSSRDRAQVLDTVRSSLEAQGRGDWAAQCALMSPKAQANVVATSRDLQTDPAYRDFLVDRSKTAATCEDAMTIYPLMPHPAGLTTQPGAFDKLKDARVSVDGDRALASELSLPLSPKRLALVRIDGRWLLEDPP